VRVAFAGKGGGGKSFIAATFARSLARAQNPVLALDLDTMPGLALSLGVDAGPEGLPEELAEERPGGGWVMREPIPAMDLVNRYSVAAPDGVRLLTLGKMPGHLKPSSSAVFRHVVSTFDEPTWSMVADLPAGVRQPSFGWADFADIVAIVVEPTAKSQVTAQRVARILASSTARVGVVISKWRPGDDAKAIAAALGLPLLGVVPYDDEVRAAESAGQAPLDAVPEAAAVKSVQRLLESLGDDR
jgi:CO dehydrogenase maturation factor